MSAPPPPAKPVRGPQLSIHRADFGGAVIFGIAFMILLVIGIGIWSHFASKTQAESFAVALTTLADEERLELPTQRESVLLKRDGVYHWRAIVWRTSERGDAPWIWSTKVRAATPMTVEDTSLVAYDPALARSLELPDDIAPSAPAP